MSLFKYLTLPIVALALLAGCNQDQSNDPDKKPMLSEHASTILTAESPNLLLSFDNTSDSGSVTITDYPVEGDEDEAVVVETQDAPDEEIEEEDEDN